MADSILAKKTLDFAIKIVSCVRELQNVQKEFVLSKQILRSGTSIGANVHEALYAQSKADFIGKISISLKEASETSYWLVVLSHTGYLSLEQYRSLKADVDEIIRIIMVII